MTWHDPLNRTGFLKPVGTQLDHHRPGLDKALVLLAMRKMAAVGMDYATVVNEGTNQDSLIPYKACGFQPWYHINGFSKPT